MNKKDVRRILIVCTGNSCRSVMAEGLFKKHFQETGKTITVLSAGTNAFSGMLPSREAIDVMHREGINVSDHKAVLITPRLIAEADVILVMEPHHRDAILHQLPGADEKVMYLRDFQKGASSRHIPDPIGKGVFFYDDVVEIIKQSMEGFFQWLGQ